MEDLIACLYPYSDAGQPDPARTAVDLNLSRKVPAQLQRPKLRDRGSRESTPPLEDNNDKEMNEEPAPWRYENGIQLKFSYGPKSGPGFVFGTSPSGCDVVLPNTCDNLISRRHCYLNFDAHNRLILRDTSTRGTAVTYDGKGRDRRRNFTWILGGDKFLDEITTIVIEFHQTLKLQIIVQKDRGLPPLYINNIDRFPKAKGAAIDELTTSILGRIAIQSEQPTAVESRARTPGPNQNSIYIDAGEPLGEGSYAFVKRVWNVSTGLVYVSKESKPLEFKQEEWGREIKLLKNLSHTHIIRLEDSLLTEKSARLTLEYVPNGTLEYQHERCGKFSLEECKTILYQGPLGLECLHERKIVHRDIKPENILVQERDPLHIKLADFGLATAGSRLETVCGTPPYLAPELAKYLKFHQLTVDEVYTDAVDIWSLGVVLFRFSYRLPQGSGYGTRWCKAIIENLNKAIIENLYKKDFGVALDLLRTGMIVWKAEKRLSAKACLAKLRDFFRPPGDDSLTPTATSYTKGYDTAVGSNSGPTTPRPNPCSGGKKSIRSSVIDQHLETIVREGQKGAFLEPEIQKNRSLAKLGEKRSFLDLAASPNSLARRRKTSHALTFDALEIDLSKIDFFPAGKGYSEMGPIGKEVNFILLRDRDNWVNITRLLKRAGYTNEQIRDFTAANRIKYQIQKGSGPTAGKYTDVETAVRGFEQVLPFAAYTLQLLAPNSNPQEGEYIPSSSPEVPEFEQEASWIRMRFQVNGGIHTVWINPESSTININQVLRAAGYGQGETRKFLLDNRHMVEYGNQAGPMRGRGKWVKLDNVVELCQGQGFAPELIAALEAAVDEREL